MERHTVWHQWFIGNALEWSWRQKGGLLASPASRDSHYLCHAQRLERDMSFRSWRERKLLSQERVADMSGLSLRTVQRLEAGHRVSYASLRALAAAFEVDADLLEREFYAVQKSTDEFVEIPRWVRLLSDRRWLGGPGLSRRDVLLIEVFCIVCAVIAFAASFMVTSAEKAATLARMSAIPFACSYLAVGSIRVLDRYKLWPGAENAAAERPRTWRTIGVEYACLCGLGILGIVLMGWLVS